MEITRKLEKAFRELELLKEQGKAEGFFNNVRNADTLCSLVEDIRDVVVDYQVCDHNELISPLPDFCVRHHYNRTYMITVVS